MRGCSGGACMVVLGGGGVHGCSGGRGACVVALGGHAWLLQGGPCVVAWGGACVVAPGGHAWFLPGGCMVLPGGMHGFSRGACMVFPRGGVHRIRQDTVNERAVRILLECILVLTLRVNSAIGLH